MRAAARRSLTLRTNNTLVVVAICILYWWRTDAALAMYTWTWTWTCSNMQSSTQTPGPGPRAKSRERRAAGAQRQRDARARTRHQGAAPRPSVQQPAKLGARATPWRIYESSDDTREKRYSHASPVRSKLHLDSRLAVSNGPHLWPAHPLGRASAPRLTSHITRALYKVITRRQIRLYHLSHTAV